MKEMEAPTGFIPLKTISEGDGWRPSEGNGVRSIGLDGPRTTTSLHYRRVPLAEPEEQIRVLNAVEIGEGAVEDWRLRP